MFLKIIDDRKNPNLNFHPPKKQARFTKNNPIEKSKEYNFNVNMSFIDFVKRFDSVYNDKEWETL